jgi:hypothetical protein
MNDAKTIEQMKQEMASFRQRFGKLQQQLDNPGLALDTDEVYDGFSAVEEKLDEYLGEAE